MTIYIIEAITTNILNCCIHISKKTDQAIPDNINKDLYIKTELNKKL